MLKEVAKDNLTKIKIREEILEDWNNIHMEEGLEGRKLPKIT